MPANQEDLVRIARAALADIEGRPPLSLAPAGRMRLRLPVPTAVAAAFLHRDLRRQFGHLLNLNRRAQAIGEADAKDRADRVEALLKSVPEHPTRVLVAAAAAVIFVLTAFFFDLKEIGLLLKVTVATLTLDYTDAYDAALNLEAGGLWWRFPLFLTLTYAAAHLLLLLGFSLKRQLLEQAAEAMADVERRADVTRFDRLAAALQREADGAPLPPAAFDQLSMAVLYLGAAASMGGVVFYIGWITGLAVLQAAAAVNLVIGLGVAAIALAKYRGARASVLARARGHSRR